MKELPLMNDSIKKVESMSNQFIEQYFTSILFYIM